MVLVTELVAALTTETVFVPELATYTVALSALTATPLGTDKVEFGRPEPITPTTVFRAVLITDTELAPELAT